MASEVSDVVLVADEDRVRTVTFNRPARANAFNAELYRAVAAALRAAAVDDGVGAVVLTGAGRTFSAGTDLREMAALLPAGDGNGAANANGGAGEVGAANANGGAGEVGRPFDAFFDALTEFPKPVVAAVNGAGIGLGFTLLAHCDLVLVAEGARLLAPFTTMGVAPEMASSYLFPRRMGRQRAAEILYTSDWVSAETLVDVGLALRVVPGERLLAETLALARAIAAKPLASLMATKRLVVEAERAGIRRAHAAEAAAFSELLRRPAMAEAILGQLGGDPTAVGSAPHG